MFLHSLDNGILDKKDIRFQRQDEAEIVATRDYQVDLIPRAIYRLPDSLHAIVELEGTSREFASELVDLLGGKEVFFIDSTPSCD